MAFTVSLLVILMSVPLMREALYERSKEWMRLMQPYKHPSITQLMQYLSIIGDGEGLFYCFAGIYYGRGKNYEFTYLTCIFFMTYHWNNFLKQGLQDSRPQFDDPSLAEENVGDCSGEFGNPSGHTLIMFSLPPTWFWLYVDTHPN